MATSRGQPANVEMGYHSAALHTSPNRLVHLTYCERVSSRRLSCFLDQPPWRETILRKTAQSNTEQAEQTLEAGSAEVLKQGLGSYSRFALLPNLVKTNYLLWLASYVNNINNYLYRNA
jgi:hypothetical protein